MTWILRIGQIVGRAALDAAVGGGGPTNGLLQEDGFFILAENGNYLVQE